MAHLRRKSMDLHSEFESKILNEFLTHKKAGIEPRIGWRLQPYFASAGELLLKRFCHFEVEYRTVWSEGWIREHSNKD